MESDGLGSLFVHPGDLTEPIFWLLPVAAALAAAAICGVALVRGRLRSTVLQAGVVFLPVLAFALSYAILMERSKKTDFCTSCHVMVPIQASALADDGSLASFHVSRGAVPAYKSCYTCHSGYGVWGDLNAKLAGMNHMIHTIRGSYELPFRMRGPYDIDACLDCHAESRSFRAVAVHQIPDIQESLRSRAMSCTGTCHPAAHPSEALAGPGGAE